MLKVLIGVFVLSLEVFAGFMGLTKDTFIVAVKKVPMFVESSTISKDIEKLPYGTEVVEVSYEGDKKVNDGWVYVQLKEDSTKKGFIVKSALLDNSIFQKVLQNSSNIVEESSDNINKISKKEDNETKNKKGKKFSDEEKEVRKIKNFSESDQKIAQKINKEELDLQNAIASIKIQSKKVSKFIKKGNLK